MEKSNTMITVLATQKFGLVNSHSWQMNAIVSVLMGRESFVVQPTGSGKSICFWIPPLHDGKTAVVIPPTISLLTDQVNKLTNRGISATFLGSAQKDDITLAILNGEYKLFSQHQSHIITVQVNSLVKFF